MRAERHAAEGGAGAAAGLAGAAEDHGARVAPVLADHDGAKLAVHRSVGVAVAAPAAERAVLLRRAVAVRAAASRAPAAEARGPGGRLSAREGREALRRGVHGQLRGILAGLLQAIHRGVVLRREERPSRRVGVVPLPASGRRPHHAGRHRGEALSLSHGSAGHPHVDFLGIVRGRLGDGRSVSRDHVARQCPRRRRPSPRSGDGGSCEEGQKPGHGRRLHCSADKRPPRWGDASAGGRPRSSSR
mmetsp:Transcript_21731/g.64743  ORF Transcript_21731/g.64743 Transcript_21731/m.64743 type:complete len:245 (+) Transcript_21731:129-863(+)